MLEEVAVVGGGRWARVITVALADLLPKSTRLMVHTAHCAGTMADWAKAELQRSVEIHTLWPIFRQPQSSAAIIANAARDHEGAALRALQAGVRVLVEKPLTLDKTSAMRVAAAGDDRLAAALVLRFAPHLHNFATVLADRGEPHLVRIHWSDAADESRYGEVKKYDSSVPVFADVLPHVVSVLSVVAPNARSLLCEQVRIARGGAEVWIRMSVDGGVCEVTLERISDRRCRMVDVHSERGQARLDFSDEPGLIYVDDRILNAAPTWGGLNRPLPQMLRHFLDWAAGGELDPRLDVGLAVQACALIDQARELYEPQLIEWLLSRPSAAERQWLRYALSELLQGRGRLDAADLEDRIEGVQQLLSSRCLTSAGLRSLLDQSGRPGWSRALARASGN